MNNFFPIIESLDQPTNKRILKTGYLGISFAMVVYVSVPFIGYLTYGTEIEANYLKTVNPDDIGRVVYVIFYVFPCWMVRSIKDGWFYWVVFE